MRSEVTELELDSLGKSPHRVLAGLEAGRRGPAWRREVLRRREAAPLPMGGRRGDREGIRAQRRREVGAAVSNGFFDVRSDASGFFRDDGFLMYHGF
jgi:hypothetical protein